MRQILKQLVLMSALTIAFNGCGGGGSSISVLPSLDEFQQHDITDVKIDILFVIDDSGSMKQGQEQLQQNFANFIGDFYNKGFNFRVAVAKSSAYGDPGTVGESSVTDPAFRCGLGNNCGGGQNTVTCSSVATTNGNGVPSLTTDHVLSSENLTQSQMIAKFIRNADVGICGSGSERSLQSAKAVLDNEDMEMYQFPRPGAHLAVIHVGDENDGPSTNPSFISKNTQGSLTHGPLSTIAAYLSDLENRDADSVSVHAIQVTGQVGVCTGNENGATSAAGYYGGVGSGSVGRIHNDGSRGMVQFDMAALTGGMQISICEPFANSLSDLGDSISSLATTFQLNEPLDSQGAATLKVYVEGLNGNDPIPNSSSNGFTYDSGTNRITFHGSMVPPQGAVIGVTYTCATLNCLP